MDKRKEKGIDYPETGREEELAPGGREKCGKVWSGTTRPSRLPLSLPSPLTPIPPAKKGAGNLTNDPGETKNDEAPELRFRHTTSAQTGIT